MAKSIWKFQLSVTDIQSLYIPADAKILSVQVQHGEPCVWALVDTDKRDESRVLRTFGTGHPIGTSDNLVFIGTYQLHGGGLVFHVFEEIRQ